MAAAVKKVREVELPVLPERYYLSHFTTVLDFVSRHYKFLLTDQEQNFLADFYKLNEDAQCLYVRLANRTKCVFYVSTLKYSEIDLPLALTELVNCKFVSSVTAVNYGADCRELLTNDQLKILLKSSGERCSGVRRDLLNRVRDRCPAEAEFSFFSKFGEAIRQERGDTVQFFLFLFFGSLQANHTEFVVRDLGLVNPYTHNDALISSKFSSRREADLVYQVSLARYELELRAQEMSAAELLNWAEIIWADEFPSPDIGESIVWKNAVGKFALSAGKLFESLKEKELALKAYEATTLYPARERRVRILNGMKRRSESLQLCEEILVSPVSEEERLFAAEFQERILSSKRRLGKTTVLKESSAISIPPSWKYRVEAGACEYFSNLGYNSWHSENFPWRNLFGLLFWDIILTEGAIHHPFQLTPSDLASSRFYDCRALAIDERCAQIENFAACNELLLRVISTQWGKPSSYVSWYKTLCEDSQLILEKVSSEKLSKIMRQICRNPKAHASGFPDLFIWNHSSYEFIEIKAEGDSLSYKQLGWLNRFREIGVNSRLVRVTFEDYPDSYSA